MTNEKEEKNYKNARSFMWIILPQLTINKKFKKKKK